MLDMLSDDARCSPAAALPIEARLTVVTELLKLRASAVDPTVNSSSVFPELTKPAEPDAPSTE